MAFPPAALRIDQVNATPQQDQHPLDHKTTNQAVNDIVAAMKIADGFVRFTPTGNSDNNQAGFTNWIVTAINIPVWATKVIITTTCASIYQAGATDGLFEVGTVLDVTPGDAASITPPGGNRMTVSYVDQWTPPRTGLVNLIIVARRAFGSSSLRADTSSSFRWAARFIP